MDIDWTRAVPLFMSEIEAMGGAERSVLAFGRWLFQQGRPSYLLTFRDRLDLPAHADFPFPKVEMAEQGGMLTKRRALTEHLKSALWGRIPMLASGYQPALYAGLTPAGRFHCLMHDTPSLFSPVAERTLSARARLAVSNRLIGNGIRRGQGCMIVTSEYLQNECQRDFGVRASIARMGGLSTAHAFRRRPVQQMLHMLSVSRLEANKRIDWLFQALAILQHAPVPLSVRVPWRLTITGRGSQEEALQRLARELGLGEHILFRGFVSDAELEDLYAQTHLFLMPAVQGYGIPAIEALQRGIPVLLSRESGVSDILRNTPWAAVLHKRDDLVPQLERMVAWLLSNQQMEVAEPENLPTESSWAERVATLCGYV